MNPFTASPTISLSTPQLILSPCLCFSLYHRTSEQATMAKAAAFFILITLVLSISSTHAASRHPADEPSSAQGFDEEKADLSCDGVGEEECLMRRTLVAHIDYIYTQGKIHG
ncbi:hypothetical protein M5K25_013245 [Dendrobium thyrsiflorum]|uniref:Phytosulfokine n=1 Tax=Dendrobium thyrsiflorum TaxID=117978 RepID=A0ABD0USP0_DENTH